MILGRIQVIANPDGSLSIVTGTVPSDRAQAIADTLRWVRSTMHVWTKDPEELVKVAYHLEHLVKVDGLDDCCPLCEEMDCDEGCPVAPLRGAA